MEKIQIRELHELRAYEEYIKGEQPLVQNVYTSSIYFYDEANKDSCGVDIHFSGAKHIDRNLQKVILKAINAACNTNFELVDDK